MHLRFVLERHLVSLFSLKPASPQFGQIRVWEGLAEPMRAIFLIFQKGKIEKQNLKKKNKKLAFGDPGSRLAHVPQDLSAALPFYTVVAGNVWRMQLCKLR